MCNNCWIENQGPLVPDVTALPTVPQPMPNKQFIDLFYLRNEHSMYRLQNDGILTSKSWYAIPLIVH